MGANLTHVGNTLIPDGTGLPVVVTGNPAAPLAVTAPGTSWKATAGITVNTNIAIMAAAPAGQRHYVTQITLSNSSAAAVSVIVKDNTTAMWQAVIPAGGTVLASFPVPLQCAVAVGINVQAAVATTTIFASLSGYTAA